MKSMKTRLGLGISVVLLAGSLSTLALAETNAGGAHPQCSGEHGKQSAGDHKAHAEERFRKADKNGDGFLTRDEVGERRWARIAVADYNQDGKISLAELTQARADGKLGHKHDRQPPA